MKFRPAALAFFALIAIPVVALALTSERAQIGIPIIINVTPNPLGYNGNSQSPGEIAVSARLRGAPAAIERAFEAQELHFLQSGSGTLVAQTVQKSVEVVASISPNPTATLLTANVTEVDISAEAGVPATFTCAYQVTVDTADTAWQLKDGLATDFHASATSFPGGDVSHNTYSGTPNPTSTPFAVYADNGGSFATVNNATYSGAKVFCVDLTLNIPITTSQGAYSSNAIYTLYY